VIAMKTTDHLPQPEPLIDEAVKNGDEAEGDFRGPYGYGRPAYKPDPAATYIFRPNAARVLPVKPQTRWR
jgi:hypothetical protein